MSLKHFHLFFIAASLTLMGYVLWWTRQQAASGLYWPGSTVAAALGSAAGLTYLAWFLRRYKSLV